MSLFETELPPLLIAANIFRHPLPILNISEHLTRLRLQTKSSLPFGQLKIIFTTLGLLKSRLVLGALLGTQNGRDVDIVNSFELVVEEGEKVDHEFLVSRRDQCACGYLGGSFDALISCSDKQVFPSLEFIGWYTVAPVPTARHIALHEQVNILSLEAILARRLCFYSVHPI